MALPCRISAYPEGGEAKIGLIRPLEMLSALSRDASSMQVAKEVEDETVKMVDEAK